MFSNTVAIQGSSLASTFYLLTEGGYDLFKAGYGKKKEAAVSLISEV